MRLYKSVLKIYFLLIICDLCFLTIACAETVVLKSGNTVEGKLIEKTDKYIKIDFQGVPLTYFFDEIETINGQKFSVSVNNKLTDEEGTGQLIQKTEEKTNPVKDIVDSVNMAVAKIDSFKADIENKVFDKGRLMILKGRLLFKRPINSRMEAESYLSENHGEGSKQQLITVTNGKVLWRYMPQLGVAAKSYLTKQSSPPPGLDFVEPFSFVDVASLKLIGQEELYGKKCNILEGNTMGAEFSSGRQLVKLWLDISNNLLYQVKTYNHSESISITVTYNNVEINKLFNDSEFEFSPPPGTQIKER